jgi:hypothetical protein
MENYDKSELIDKYLNGQLHGKALEDFKRELENPEFALDVEAQSAVNSIIIEHKLTEISAKINRDLSKKSSLLNWKTAGIAIICLAALIGYLTFEKPDLKTTPDQKVLHHSIDSIQTPATLELNKGISPNTQKTIQNTVAHKKETLPDNTNIYKAIHQKENSDTAAIEKKVTPSIHTKPPEVSQKIANTTSVILKVDSCKDVKITAETTVKNACEKEANGIITVLNKKIHGGKPPFQFGINDDSFTALGQFQNLTEGNYTLKIKDANGCIDHVPVKVGSQKCQQFKRYSFNPLSETWKFPINPDDNGTLTIYDKNGAVLYTTKIIGGHPLDWDGKAMNGSDTGSGSYYYSLELQNGNSEPGYITIIR